MLSKAVNNKVQVKKCIYAQADLHHFVRIYKCKRSFSRAKTHLSIKVRKLEVNRIWFMTVIQDVYTTESK